VHPYEPQGSKRRKFGYRIRGSVQALTDAPRQTLSLFAFDRRRVANAAADPPKRATIHINPAMHDALLLIALAIGDAPFGAAFLD